MPSILTGSLALVAVLATLIAAYPTPDHIGRATRDGDGAGWTCVDQGHFLDPSGLTRECAPGALCTTTTAVQFNPCGYVEDNAPAPSGNATGGSATTGADEPECDADPEEPESTAGGETVSTPATTAAATDAPVGASAAATQTGPSSADDFLTARR